VTSQSLVLATGFQSVIERYAGYGPLLTAFLANLLATFGDKGQLVVVTLATRYDAKRVFAGGMAAFSLWSATEVLLGQWIVQVLPSGVISTATGGMFILFGMWTLVSGIRTLRVDDAPHVPLVTNGGANVGIPGRLLPDRVIARIGGFGGVVTSFVFILFAEFGDKTQVLTINLAATFPDAPIAVFVGVVAALGLRTGVDAIVGGQFERFVPTVGIELFAAAVFVGFGLLVFGLIPGGVLIAVLGVGFLAGLWWAISEYFDNGPDANQ